jgi:uncharacterized protein with HEPN domain
MNDRVLKYLLDIQTSAKNISDFLGEKRDFKEFSNNLMLKQAVERNLEIIGEAVNNALKIMPDLPITNARKIVDLRNKLIHAYDSIDDAMVWAIVVRHLPVLYEEVRNLSKTD